MADLRFPTAQELEDGFALQQAEDAACATVPRPRALRDQDVTEAPAPTLPKAYCPQCGRVFDYATLGMSVLQMKAHQKRAHPEAVEAY